MSRTLTPCPACGAVIWHAMSLAGQRLPLERDVDPDGTVIPVVQIIDGAMAYRVQVLTGDQLPAQGRAYRDHRPRCGRAAADTRPRCPACHGPMDPWLADNGWRWHICCAPPSRAEIAAYRTSPAGSRAGEGLRPAGEHHPDRRTA